MQFTVKDPAPLMDFLMKALHGKSRTGIKAMLAKRLVSVDHEVTTQFNQTLLPGQTVMIGKKSPAEAVVLAGVKIIYDDDDLVVIEKSAGLLSVPTDTGTEKSALGIATAHLKRLNHKARLFIVHRLDRDTSGLMMFVKNKELQRQLRQNWQESVLTRRYAVVVEGSVIKDKGTIVSWLKGTDGLRTYSSQTVGEGQKAISHYKVVNRSFRKEAAKSSPGKSETSGFGADGFTLLDVELETGRKNQIRVHMEDLGHPVIGDDKYGATQNPIGRLGLHARVLEFTHPKTQKQMSFEAETPKEFLRLFRPS
jgi:23S rRNA pseudouridine1911/1915/1917 synthase